MWYKKYDNVFVKDFCSVYVGISSMIVFGILWIFLIDGWQRMFFLFPISIAIFVSFSSFLPLLESFSILPREIITKKIKKEKSIELGYNLILVISYAAFVTLLAQRTGDPKDAIFLKDRISVSVLRSDSLENVKKTLHEHFIYRPFKCKYTNFSVETNFKENDFLYSFVGNKDLIDDLINSSKYKVIVPESLCDKYNIDVNRANVFVDWGW